MVRGVEMADDGEDDLFPIAVLIDELKTDDTQVRARGPTALSSSLLAPRCAAQGTRR